ncbi:MAG: hypothetical protein ISN64_03200 [Rickettsia sp.]|nr:hypothetical protein [Rickettsia sp.]
MNKIIDSKGKRKNFQKEKIPSYDAFFKSGMKDPIIREQFLHNHLPPKFVNYSLL